MNNDKAELGECVDVLFFCDWRKYKVTRCQGKRNNHIKEGNNGSRFAPYVQN
jgi:hypothetical protein